MKYIQLFEKKKHKKFLVEVVEEGDDDGDRLNIWEIHFYNASKKNYMISHIWEINSKISASANPTPFIIDESILNKDVFFESDIFEEALEWAEQYLEAKKYNL